MACYASSQFRFCFTLSTRQNLQAIASFFFFFLFFFFSTAHDIFQAAIQHFMAGADRQAHKLLVHDNLYCLVFKLRALFQVLIESNLTVTKGSWHEFRLMQFNTYSETDPGHGKGRLPCIFS